MGWCVDNAAVNLAEWALDAGYGLGWSMVRRLPPPVARGLFTGAAELAARRDGPAVRQLRTNLRRAAPQAGADELDALVRAGLRSYARYWREAFCLPTADHEAIYRRVDALTVGREHLLDALTAGRGAVVALPHTGNWDVAGLWLVHALRAWGRPAQFSTIVARLRPESLYRRFVDYRESLGFEILPTSGYAELPLRTLARRLAVNGVVCLLADLDLTRRGVPVTFLGSPARMPPGPARLAADTGAALLPVSCSFTDHPEGWRQEIHPAVPVSEVSAVGPAVQHLADTFGAAITARPQDWHMTQRIWRDRGPRSRPPVP